MIIIEKIRFTKADLVAYQGISQDKNPVHETGVVYGIQLMARIEGYLKEWLNLNEVTSFEYHLLQPLIINQTASLVIATDGNFELFYGVKCLGKGKINGK